MIKTMTISLVFAFAYLNISCWCKGRELDRTLIDSSSIIFTGKITSIKYVEDSIHSEYYHIVTFKVLKLYKGEKQKAVVLKHISSSCGFLPSNNIDKYIGHQCVLYSTKIDGYYSYNMCDNRIVFEKPIRYEYWEEDYKKQVPGFAAKYKKEIVTLDSLLQTK